MTFNYGEYQKLVRDAVFTALDAAPSLIGEYNFEALGQTTPAIRIDDGTVLPDDVVKPVVTGLEVLIQPYPQIPLTPLLDNAYQLTVQVRVTLKQWDITKRTLEAASRLEQLDYQIDNRSLIPRNPAIDNIEVLSMVLVSFWEID